MGEIRYELTEGDYLRAFQLRRRSFPSVNLSMCVMNAAAVVGVLVIAAVLYATGRTFRRAFGISFVIPVCVFCVAYWGVFFAPKYSIRKQLKGSPGTWGPKTLSWGDEGIRYQGAMGDGRLTWNALVKWGESDGLFYVSPGVKMYVPIPKRAMTAEQVDEFRALLKSKVSGQPGKLRKVSA